MHIACPNCHAIYDVPESKLEAALSLRCHACRFSWPLEITRKPQLRLPAPKDQRTEPAAPFAPTSDPLSASAPALSAPLPENVGLKTTSAPLKEVEQPILASEPSHSPPFSALLQEFDAKMVDAAPPNRPVTSNLSARPSSSAPRPDAKWPAFNPQTTSPAAMYAESSLIPEESPEDLDHLVHTDDEPNETSGRFSLRSYHLLHILFWVGLPILILLTLIILYRVEVMQIIPASSSWFGKLGFS